MISPSGGEARRLTRLSTGAGALRWFAGSQRFAFLSSVWPELKSDEQQAKRLKERAEAKVKAFAIETTSYRYWDRWMADGRVSHIHAVEVATGETRDLMAGWTNGFRAVEPSADLYDLAPDGQELAFVAEVGPDPGLSPNTDVVLWSVADGAWRNLTADNPAHDSNPRYSPDGRSLAWLQRVKPRFYADRPRVAIWDRVARSQRVLTEGWDGSPNGLAWTPDSQRLLFTAEEKAREPLWSLAASGGPPTMLVPSVVAFGLSGDGRTLAYTRSSLSEPAEVFVRNLAGGEAKRLEAFNGTLVASWKLGRVAETNVPGWNGEPVQSWVVYPPGFDPSKKWPLLQIVHGGPHNAWLDQFRLTGNPHLFAAAGYVVACVNFHGSTGWGQAFVESNLGRYGEKEFADIEAVTAALLATGFIDPDRLTAVGASFGGSMMEVMNGRTHRYRAFVCHAGVFNWESMLAMDAPTMVRDSLETDAWMDRERYLKQSPHLLAKDYATPTLVVHVELDFRVPVSQGLEYYNTLRLRGVPARLLNFPDENHFIRKPQNSRLWHTEVLGWLARFAPGGGK